MIHGVVGRLSAKKCLKRLAGIYRQSDWRGRGDLSLHPLAR